MNVLIRSLGTGIAVLVLATAAMSARSRAASDDTHAAPATSAPADSAVIAIGKKIFFDSSLSASKKIACSSCHDPNHAYAPPNTLAVQLGGAQLDAQGMRAVPSLRYVLNRTPIWNKTYVSNLAERIREGNEPPTGGFGADGRFNSLHEQAAFPLLASNEMANERFQSVVAALSSSRYAEDFRRAFGAHIFQDTTRAFAQALYAIERFELQDASFHPYDSKYDAYLDGKIELSAAERRGLALFDDPRRGNCSSCHLDEKGADGSHPLFTDYQFGAIGVPRNAELAANRDAAYFDKGLCGPARADQREHSEYCGMFKTPTLRNVATRGAFFHNGRFHDLKDALRFYASRDVNAEKWYSHSVKGGIEKFDDLPRSVRGNVDTTTVPFDRHRGQRAAWSDADIDDVVAFLKTLNDGFGAKDKRTN